MPHPDRRAERTALGVVCVSCGGSPPGFESRGGGPSIVLLLTTWLARTALRSIRYVGRSFIEPNTFLRQSAVNRKFGPLVENIAGKRVVLVDDSIVRGNTMGPIVKLLRKAGATEVHVRIVSPPLKYPCYMGINIPSPEELIANNRTIVSAFTTPLPRTHTRPTTSHCQCPHSPIITAATTHAHPPVQRTERL